VTDLQIDIDFVNLKKKRNKNNDRDDGCEMRKLVGMVFVKMVMVYKLLQSYSVPELIFLKLCFLLLSDNYLSD